MRPMGAITKPRDDRWPGERREWARPPVGGWVADDLDRLPNLPPHTELIAGSLVLMCPQTLYRAVVTSLLDHGLRTQVPDDLLAVRGMTVDLDRRNRAEPEVMVVRRVAATDGSRTSFAPAQVVLAVEVESEDSAQRDREVKPRKYAGAGIAHYWRVEEADGQPVVHVHELDPATRTYLVTGVHRERLKLTVPFDVEIGLGT
ncbi:Uma2 family endonuclease [Streptomyces uncialis]|uniref:Uma2 family endonuclease n=1 Tax=Streptomyces uncialis TaxID=1048205 RepID=UPI00366716F9